MKLETTLEEKIENRIQYLLVEVELRNWHGVQDAASDLRELELRLKLEKEYKNELKLMQQHFLKNN